MSSSYSSINWFINQGYTIYNLTSSKEPYDSKKKQLLGCWNVMTADEFKETIDYKCENWGIRTGRQENGKHIIVLDFDMWYKKEKPNICHPKLDKILRHKFVEILAIISRFG